MYTYLGAVIATLVLFHLAFLFALKTKRNDLADVIWGPSFVLAAAGAIMAEGLSAQSLILGPREVLILSLLTIWAVRLFLHIGIRTLRKPSEDIRYKNMRAGWAEKWVSRTYLYVFILQGFLMLIVDLGVLRSLEVSPRPIDWIVFTGTALWIAGFAFESIGDRQLQKFTQTPANRGRVMNQGLWRWSRHPNYFGEVVQWWGLFLICVDGGSWWIVLSPLTITFLILKVSGVPMLEKVMSQRPGYAEYQTKTSKFIPWFAKY